MSEIELSETPELTAARRAREAQEARAAEATQPRPIPPPAIPDPLPLCVYTTVALLAWLLTPALAAAVFGAVPSRPTGDPGGRACAGATVSCATPGL
jgi:hypothetical protein